MPVSLATIYRGVILLAIIEHVMYMYGMARVMGESTGLQSKPMLVGGGFALAMVIPLFFAAGLPELPEVLAHRRRERRWARNRCPECAYDLEGNASRFAERCPECGGTPADPRGYQFSWRTLRRFAIMAVAGWLVGCVACESLLLLDEWHFEQEVRARPGELHWSRARAWPFGSASLMYVPEEGISATD